MVQPKTRRVASEAYADTAKTDAIADATTKYGGLPARVTAVEQKNTEQDTAIAEATRGRKAVPNNDLDALTVPNDYHLTATNHPSNPFPGQFAFVKLRDYLPFGTGLYVEVRTWETVQRVATRIYNGGWKPWVYEPTRADITTLDAKIEGVASTVQVRGETGTKVVPLAFTASQGPFKEVMIDHTARYVRRYAVAPGRIRVHVANYNPGQGVAGGTVSLNGVWLGKGDENGNVTNNVLAPGSTVAMAGGQTGLVTPWMDSPVKDGEFIAITVAWYAVAGTEVMQMQGGGWVFPDNAARTDMTTAGWTRKQATPFQVWIEAEVPAATPVICGHGDSITIGTASTDPVGDSYVAKYAYDQGALPVILAEHGSTMNGWNLSARRWDQYPGIKLSEIVDATITTMGQNDLAKVGITTAEMKTLHETMMPLLRKHVGGVIYTGLLTPSSKTADLEVIRKAHNTYLATLATGARGVIDFATAVGTADGEALAPEYSADGLHPNTAGQQAMANKVLANPVTPYTLPPSKLKALAALL